MHIKNNTSIKIIRKTHINYFRGELIFCSGFGFSGTKTGFVILLFRLSFNSSILNLLYCIIDMSC